MREALASGLISGAVAALLVAAVHAAPGLPHNAAGGVVLGVRGWLTLWAVGSLAGPIFVAAAR